MQTAFIIYFILGVGVWDSTLKCVILCPPSSSDKFYLQSHPYYYTLAMLAMAERLAVTMTITSCNAFFFFFFLFA